MIVNDSMAVDLTGGCFALMLADDRARPPRLGTADKEDLRGRSAALPRVLGTHAEHRLHRGRGDYPEDPGAPEALGGAAVAFAAQGR